MANPSSKSGSVLTELEHRQASILSRIAGLYGSFNSLNCEVVEAQNSRRNNSRDENVSFSLEVHRRKLGKESSQNTGEEALQNINGVNSPIGSEVICGRTGGEDERGRCSDDNHEQDADVENRLSKILRMAGANFLFKRVPPDYYARSFEERRDLLGAATVDHLCKSIVMVNTQAHESVLDCSNHNNSKYYVIVVQYIARLNAEKVRHFVHSLNNGKIPKKRFNLRLAPEEESNRLTGFEHNAVTPFGMSTNIPVIFSDAVAKLQPGFFWLGGGEVDLKLGINTGDFLKIINPFVVDCTY